MVEKIPAFPTLKTERLILRATDFSDIEEIYFLRSDPEVNKHLGGGRCENLEAAKAHITLVQDQFAAGMTFNWSICLRESGTMIGSICLWNICRENLTAEIGYALHPEFQNKGFMNESLKIVLEYGFEDEEFRLIEAYTNKENKTSIRLLVKNNFEWDKSKQDGEDPHNRIYTLCQEKWSRDS